MIQGEMDTGVTREGSSVDIDNADPFGPGVLNFGFLIGRSITLQSFTKFIVDDMHLRLGQVELVHILRLSGQNSSA